MSGNGQEVCDTCKLPARGNAKLHTCDNCSLRFHTACKKLAAVTIDSKPGKACTECIKQAWPKSSAPHDRTRSTSNASSTSNTSTTEQTQDDKLNTILREICGLKSSVSEWIDGFKSEVNERFDGLKSEVNVRFDDLDSKLKELDVIPGLVARVENAEAELYEVKRELAELKQMMQSPTDSANSHRDPELVSKVLSLERKNADLSKSLAEVQKSRSSSCTDIVIGGLSVPPMANPKAIVLAVLKSVHPDIDSRDIITTRIMVSKSAVSSAIGKTVTEITTADGDSAGTKPKNFATSSSAAPIKSPRPPSILVTLSSRALLVEIIQSKIKLGKLHSSALVPHLPAGIDHSSIVPSILNINEFLPKNIFILHRTVREKARQPSSGFTSFIRSGQIFVRRKKGDVATLISSEEDLQRFLA